VGAQITEIAPLKTGLPHARLEGERGPHPLSAWRFVSQTHIRIGAYLDPPPTNTALPDRQPLAAPLICG